MDASVWIKVLIPLLAKAGSAESADDSRSHGLAQTERVSDRDYEIAHLDLVAVTRWNGLQFPGLTLKLKHGNVSCGIAPNQFRVKLPSVPSRDLGARDLRDNVIGGEHIAAFGVNDYARTRRLDFLFKLLGQIEKLRKTGSR